MKPKEKSETEKANDKIVTETIKLFEPVNLGVQKLYGNKTERKDVLALCNIVIKGVRLQDKLPDVIAFLSTYNESLKPNKAGKVFGKVIKPSDLLLRLQDVFDAKRKLDKELDFRLKKEEIRKEEIEEEKTKKKEEDQYTKDQLEDMRKKRNEQMKLAIKGF